MDVEQRTAVFKALGHPARLRMVDALGEGELCVCDLVKIAGLQWSTVSRHLAILKDAGVVDDERRGKQIFYRLTLCCVADMNRCLDGRQEASCASSSSTYSCC
jgi:ArsR family transcriptional regulator